MSSAPIKALPQPSPAPAGPLGRTLAWLAASGPRAYLSLAALSGFLLFYRLGARPLFEPDEGRYAEIPREMVALHDWLTPHLNYVVYFEKPPLVYWMTAGLYRLMGASPLAARIPSAIFTLLAVLATAYFGRRLFGRTTGWLGAAILGTSLAAIWIGRLATLDAVLACLVTIAIFAFHRALSMGPGETRRRDAWLLAGYASGALATLVKGPVGAVLPALVIGLYLLATKRLREIGRMRLVAGLVFALLIVAPWFVLVGRANPGFERFFFVHETLLRYVSTVHRRSGSVIYYVPVLLLGLAPWTLLVPRALHDAWRDRGRPGGDAPLFLAIWAGSILAFYSFAGSKLPGYILPVFPPLALLLARTFLSGPATLALQALAHDRWLRGSVLVPIVLGLLLVAVPPYWYGMERPEMSRAMRWMGAMTLGLGLLSLAALRLRRPSACLALLAGWVLILHPISVWVSERLGDRYSVAAIAEGARGQIGPSDRIVQYRGYAEGLPFYFARRIVLFRHVGELYEGYVLATPADRRKWFLQGEKDFTRLLAGPAPVFVVTSAGDLPELERSYPALVRMSGTAHYFLLRTHPGAPRAARAAFPPARSPAGARGSPRALARPAPPRLRPRGPSS